MHELWGAATPLTPPTPLPGGYRHPKERGIWGRQSSCTCTHVYKILGPQGIPGSLYRQLDLGLTNRTPGGSKVCGLLAHELQGAMPQHREPIQFVATTAAMTDDCDDDLDDWRRRRRRRRLRPRTSRQPRVLGGPVDDDGDYVDGHDSTVAEGEVPDGRFQLDPGRRS